MCCNYKNMELKLQHVLLCFVIFGIVASVPYGPPPADDDEYTNSFANQPQSQLTGQQSRNSYNSNQASYSDRDEPSGYNQQVAYDQYHRQTAPSNRYGSVKQQTFGAGSTSGFVATVSKSNSNANYANSASTSRPVPSRLSSSHRDSVFGREPSNAYAGSVDSEKYQSSEVSNNHPIRRPENNVSPTRRPARLTTSRPRPRPRPVPIRPSSSHRDSVFGNEASNVNAGSVGSERYQSSDNANYNSYDFEDNAPIRQPVHNVVPARQPARLPSSRLRPATVRPSSSHRDSVFGREKSKPTSEYSGSVDSERYQPVGTSDYNSFEENDAPITQPDRAHSGASSVFGRKKLAAGSSRVSFDSPDAEYSYLITKQVPAPTTKPIPPSEHHDSLKAVFGRQKEASGIRNRDSPSSQSASAAYSYVIPQTAASGADSGYAGLTQGYDTGESAYEDERSNQYQSASTSNDRLGSSDRNSNNRGPNRQTSQNRRPAQGSVGSASVGSVNKAPLNKNGDREFTGIDKGVHDRVPGHIPQPKPAIDDDVHNLVPGHIPQNKPVDSEEESSKSVGGSSDLEDVLPEASSSGITGSVAVKFNSPDVEYSYNIDGQKAGSSASSVDKKLSDVSGGSAGNRRPNRPVNVPKLETNKYEESAYEEEQSSHYQAGSVTDEHVEASDRNSNNRGDCKREPSRKSNKNDELAQGFVGSASVGSANKATQEGSSFEAEDRVSEQSTNDREYTGIDKGVHDRVSGHVPQTKPIDSEEESSKSVGGSSDLEDVLSETASSGITGSVAVKFNSPDVKYSYNIDGGKAGGRASSVAATASNSESSKSSKSSQVSESSSGGSRRNRPVNSPKPGNKNVEEPSLALIPPEGLVDVLAEEESFDGYGNTDSDSQSDYAPVSSSAAEKAYQSKIESERSYNRRVHSSDTGGVSQGESSTSSGNNGSVNRRVQTSSSSSSFKKTTTSTGNIRGGEFSASDSLRNVGSAVSSLRQRRPASRPTEGVIAAADEEEEYVVRSSY